MILSSAIVLTSLFFNVALNDFDSAKYKADGEKIGIIEIIGVISDSKTVNEKLRLFREDESIKAIIIRVDSPGGGVVAAQEIFREIEKTVEVKKVITSMGAVAASGGYYIAAATNGIIANPGTVTGSIGVIMVLTNIEALMKKIGLIPIVIKSGDYKDIGSSVREMSDAERKIMQNLSDTIHRQFIKAISDGRKMDTDAVTKLADGRIFSGEEALTLGLVDRIGNLEDAIKWAGKMANIEGEPSPVYAPEKKKPILDYLIEYTAGKLKSHAEYPGIDVEYRYRPSPKR